MSRPPIKIPGRDFGADRELETIVLTQLRDSMSLVNTNMAATNSNMAKLTDKIDAVDRRVIELASAKYDQQIEKMEAQFKEDLQRTEESLQRQITINRSDLNKHEERLGSQSVQIARLGLGMAIAGAVGGTALGTTLTLLVTKLVGHT